MLANSAEKFDEAECCGYSLILIFLLPAQQLLRKFLESLILISNFLEDSNLVGQSQLQGPRSAFFNGTNF